MKTGIASKARESNLDLLRILSMLLIIFLHSIDHSGVLENVENCSIGMYLYVRFTYLLCQVCVNIYVMLSGYFLVQSEFRLKKLITLWLDTVFYSVVLRLLFVVAGVRSFSIISLVSCAFPTLTGRYWFVTIYVGLYLIFPFLNILIRAMNRRQHTMLNICLVGLFPLWNSIHPSIAGMNSGGSWGLAWFVVLYMAAAWLRLYYVPNGKTGWLLATFLAIPALITGLQCMQEGAVQNLVQTVVEGWYRYDSLPVYVMSICLFVAFLNIEVIGDKWIKLTHTVAPLTFGVYLIHTHADVSPWSWELFALPAKMSRLWFPLLQLGTVLGIFAICAVMDAVKEIAIGRLKRLVWLEKQCSKISEMISE